MARSDTLYLALYSAGGFRSCLRPFPTNPLPASAAYLKFSHLYAVNASTAILLFSRTARAEAAVKGFGGETRVAESLIRRTEATIGRTGLPFFRSTEADQRGATFGQRLAEAMQQVYDQGFDKLIVGTCAPPPENSTRAIMFLVPTAVAAYGLSACTGKILWPGSSTACAGALKSYSPIWPLCCPG